MCVETNKKLDDILQTLVKIGHNLDALHVNAGSFVDCEDLISQLADTKQEFKCISNKITSVENAILKSHCNDYAHQKVLRKVRSILNKLTPENISRLCQKLQSLPINNEMRLNAVTELIFEKATDEPIYCKVYAEFCQNMPVLSIQHSNRTGDTVDFRKVLFTLCQRKFERDHLMNEDPLYVLRSKLSNATTVEEKQQFKEELEYAETKERRRMLGNIRFIGELFKLNMLTESIMDICITSLLEKRDEKSLESLCHLLTTVGQKLDYAENKEKINKYFADIGGIIEGNMSSLRIRFLLQDVVELRQNKWVPRANKSFEPKTIDQIRVDARQEQESLQAVLAAVQSSLRERRLYG